MPLVFKTPNDQATDVEIVGVGLLPAEGKGGILVEQAAPRMVELQETDDYGRPLTVNGKTFDEEPNGQIQILQGAKLTAAAKAFAEARGLEAVNIAEDKLAKMRAESGHLADIPSEDLRETNIALREELWPDLQPVNQDNEALNIGGLTALTPGETGKGTQRETGDKEPVGDEHPETVVKTTGEES